MLRPSASWPPRGHRAATAEVAVSARSQRSAGLLAAAAAVIPALRTHPVALSRPVVPRRSHCRTPALAASRSALVPRLSRWRGRAGVLRVHRADPVAVSRAALRSAGFPAQCTRTNGPPRAVCLLPGPACRLRGGRRLLIRRLPCPSPPGSTGCRPGPAPFAAPGRVGSAVSILVCLACRWSSPRLLPVVGLVLGPLVHESSLPAGPALDEVERIEICSAGTITCRVRNNHRCSREPANGTGAARGVQRRDVVQFPSRPPAHSGPVVRSRGGITCRSGAVAVMDGPVIPEAEKGIPRWSM